MALSQLMQIEIGWILGIIATLGTVIATLSGVLWSTMKERLATQDRIIEGMREDINRMSKGCGVDTCHWRAR